jgi:hypothetical protein
MSQPVSDAAFELLGACVHSLRFAFGAPLEYPYAPARLADENPPPALFRRLQAASPPPSRNGEPWYTGLSLDGKPFQPSSFADRLAEVKYDEGAASLDAPDPQRIVLDRHFRIPRQQQTMAFPGPDCGRYLTSIDYWSPIPPSADATVEQVEYYDTFRMEWDRAPVGDWVAVSFDAFWPPERDSADLIIPLGDCDGHCPGAAA